MNTVWLLYGKDNLLFDGHLGQITAFKKNPKSLSCIIKFTKMTFCRNLNVYLKRKQFATYEYHIKYLVKIYFEV